MPVPFDENAADSLVRVARGAANTLREQSGPRRAAAERAAHGFTGAHAGLFERACGVEAEDRGKLAGVLSELADQVTVVGERARRENAREQATVAWEARAKTRLGDIRAGRPPRANLIGSVGVVAFDPRPSDIPETPPAVRAAFSPRYRSRVHGGGGSSRSGALPDRLEGFVVSSRPLNLALERELSPLWTAWARLVDSSPWMRVDTATFLSGFQAYLAENSADIAWLARIAAAFRVAGGGTLLASTLNASARVRPRMLGDDELLAKLAEVPEADLAALLSAAPGLRTQLEQLDPSAIAQWWSHLADGEGSGSLSVRQEVLLRRFPGLFGNLDGIPAAARVRAHQLRAPALLSATRAEIRRLERADPRGDAGRLAFLRSEVAYLRRVRDGDAQLYLYDRDTSRIVEVLGTPRPGAQRAVTYVPGTFTGLDSFYRGDVQQVGSYLAQHSTDTVVFVYKDGPFPGEDPMGLAPKPLRIREANDPERVRAAGEQLRRFSEGARTDPVIGDLTQVGVGHSWGLVNLGASERDGARYDTVVSLSGAGLPAGWSAQPGTGYFDLSYTDLLQQAQEQGYVWRGNTPRRRPEFVNMPLYRGPNDAALAGPGMRNVGEKIGVLIDNHNLIASDRPGNKQALEDLKRLVGV